MLGPPYLDAVAPAVEAARCAILGLALAVAIVVTWRKARTHPAPALASGLVLLSVAYPLVWVLLRTDPVPTPWWLYNGAYPLLLAAVPAAARPLSPAPRRTG